MVKVWELGVEVAVIFVLILASLALPAMATFDTPVSSTVDSCYSQIITGSCIYSGDKTVDKASGWSNDMKKWDTEKWLTGDYMMNPEGLDGIEAVWWQPASECGMNTTDSKICGNTYSGVPGRMTYPFTMSPGSNNTVVLGWHARKCDFRPEKCNGWWCANGTQYYGDGTNTGEYAVSISSPSYSWTGHYTASDVWSGTFTNIPVNSLNISSTSSYLNFTVRPVGSMTGPSGDCVEFDQVSLGYGSVSGGSSPGPAYVADMTTLIAFPFNNIISTTSSVSISKAFATIPIVQIVYDGTGFIYSGGHCTQDFGTT